jgi:hypothetical protein
MGFFILSIGYRLRSDDNKMAKYEISISEIAQRLYVVGGYSYEKISDLLEIPQSQLLRWSNTWATQRKKYCRSMAGIEVYKADLYLKVLAGLDDALDKKDSKLIYPLTRMLEIFTKSEGTQSEAVAKVDTPEEAVTALWTALGTQIGMMAVTPGNGDTKEIERLLKVIDQIKTDYGVKDDSIQTATTLSEETKQKVRDMYGL